jgi:hypothetical protein
MEAKPSIDVTALEPEGISKGDWDLCCAVAQKTLEDGMLDRLKAAGAAGDSDAMAFVWISQAFLVLFEKVVMDTTGDQPQIQVPYA